MSRVLLSLLAALLLQLVALAVAPAVAAPEFKMGFGVLASMIPSLAGTPLEDEQHNPQNGDGLQRTTTGLMVWRKADNWTAFTDGATTWINGPVGLRMRPNDQRFDWELAATLPPVAAAPPVPPPPTAAAPEVPATVASWSRLFSDQRLRDALSLAYAHGSAWRPLADKAAERNTQVRWADLPQGVGGVTSYVSSRAGLRVQIHINSGIEDEPLQVAAAVLAHEAYHAATASVVRDVEACYQNEAAAFRWESYVWKKLPRPAVETGLTRFEDHLVSLVDSGQIDSYVRGSSGYQRECSTAGS